MHYEVNDSDDDRDAEDWNGKKMKQWIETGVIGKRLRPLFSHDADSFARASPWTIPKWTCRDEQVSQSGVKNCRF